MTSFSFLAWVVLETDHFVFSTGLSSSLSNVLAKASFLDKSGANAD